MLSRKEKVVMKSIYYEAVKKKGVCLMRPIDVMSNMTPKVEISCDDVDIIINALELDGYFDKIETSKKGETFWCFTLKQKGHAFYREILNEKRAIYFKISLSVAIAIGIFIFKLILDAIAGN